MKTRQSLAMMTQKITITTPNENKILN